jgi:hypothetical protein
MGETSEERVFRERRNSRRRDRRRAQEQAEQDARQRRENPLFGRNMASPLGVKPPEPNQRRPRLAELPGDGRGTTTTTLLPGTDIIPDDRRTHVEYPHLLRALGLFSGPLTSRYPTSTSMNLSRIQEAGWPSTPPPLEPPEHLKT